jgi:hypothetical protein
MLGPIAGLSVEEAIMNVLACVLLADRLPDVLARGAARRICLS